METLISLMCVFQCLAIGQATNKQKNWKEQKYPLNKKKYLSQFVSFVEITTGQITRHKQSFNCAS